MKITISTAKNKRYNHLLFKVICDDKSTDNLNYSEMLGLISALTMPEERPTELLLTKEQKEEVKNLIK